MIIYQRERESVRDNNSHVSVACDTNVARRVAQSACSALSLPSHIFSLSLARESDGAERLCIFWDTKTQNLETRVSLHKSRVEEGVTQFSPSHYLQ
jgi:hypothetical protein